MRKLTLKASILVMCLSNDCYIRVIHSLMTVLLEYIDLNEYSLLKNIRSVLNLTDRIRIYIRFSLIFQEC